MRRTPTILALGGLLALVLVVPACFNTNPYRAGEGTDGSLKSLPHNVKINGVGHADGICDPIDFCSACHGSSLQGGPGGEPSCTRCHGPVWGNADCGSALHTVSLGGHRHAPNFCKAWDNCTGCHGAELKGGAKGQPSCYSCHGAVWDSPNCGQNIHTVNISGVMHAANYCTPLANCTGCHGADLRGGTSGQPSCYSCHSDLWTKAGCGQNIHTDPLGGVYHAPNYCRPYQNCTDCHGAQLHGGSGGQPSCLSCHDQKKWMNCGSTQHTHSFDGHNHATGYCQPFDYCAFCHGSQLQGGPNNEPSCTKCHDQKWNSSDCGNISGRVR